jgi:transposase InsO family protein
MFCRRTLARRAYLARKRVRRWRLSSGNQDQKRFNACPRVGIRISMDGKGRCIDNIFIERLWRSLKYECVYLHAWETSSQAKADIGRWMAFYNQKRPHAVHGGQPPAVVYWNQIQPDR